MSKAPALTEQEKADLRRWYATGAFTQRELANIYAVHQNTIHRALRTAKRPAAAGKPGKRRISSSLTDRNTIIAAERLLLQPTYAELKSKWHVSKRRAQQITREYGAEAVYAIKMLKAQAQGIPDKDLQRAIVSFAIKPGQRMNIKEIQKEIKARCLDGLTRYELEAMYILALLWSFELRRAK